MYSPRFTHPNYIRHQSQWRPHGPRFGTMGPLQDKNHSIPMGHHFSNNNEDHWCETCDRGFRTIELLTNHKQQHQKCNIDGCQFIAHPKVVTKHIQMQHSTGLYNKISKLDNPEEIQKWRAERKKRYPTKENIEKKNAEIKEKIDRGEKMGIRSHREYKGNRREQGMKRKCTYDNNRKNFKRKFPVNKSFNETNNKKVDTIKKPPVQSQEKSIPENGFPQVDNSKTLKPFAGILNLLDDESPNDTQNDDVKDCKETSDTIEDDEYMIMDESDYKNNSLVSEPVVCGALSSLICNYESSDEESVHNNTQLHNNKPESLITKKDNDQNMSTKPDECLKNNVNDVNDLEQNDDDSGPEEAKIVKNINNENNIDVSSCNKESSNLEPSEKAKGRDRQDKNRTNNTKPISKKFKSKLPSTLLEKLLYKEIRQERNIVLQCIRHIIKNNYFEKSKDIACSN